MTSWIRSPNYVGSHRFNPLVTGDPLVASDTGGSGNSTFCVVESSISETRRALDEGRISSVELVHAFLNRIARFDRHGTRLNAVPVLNPTALEEAALSDSRRARGETPGRLEGIPYTAKDSYKVRGMTVSAGSPAFEDLVAQDDAFVIDRLRAEGAILIGLTNMPPMAGGGMQRGLYGRAESPYNEHFLSSAYGSGSSNGSGVATTANFASFGLGEETWSSGRAPASNNSLVAYTPSRGVISMRGNWPLYATMDVVVPHTRTVDDLMELLDVIVADDAEARGDFWRRQPFVAIPKASDVRPDDYRSLRTEGALAGKRLGVPKMYLNADPASRNPIQTRRSVMALWQQSREDLESLGAEIVEVDFPAVSNYEKDRHGAESMYDRGLVPPGFLHTEMWPMVIHTWNDFLAQNGDPSICSLDDVDGRKIFPIPPGALPDRYEDDPDMAELTEVARGNPVDFDSLPHLEEGLKGLEQTRRIDFEDWLAAKGLDGIVFPAAADVAPFDADYNPVSNDVAWKNGVTYSNGNLVIRHLGIPTVTVPMGTMSDIGMPVGLTFAGPAYSDTGLISIAHEFERSRTRRVPPPRTPETETDRIPVDRRPWSGRSPEAPRVELMTDLGTMDDDGQVTLNLRVEVETDAPVARVQVTANGEPVEMEKQESGFFTGSRSLPATIHYQLHSPWRGPYGSLISAVATDETGRSGGSMAVAGGI